MHCSSAPYGDIITAGLGSMQPCLDLREHYNYHYTLPLGPCTAAASFFRLIPKLSAGLKKYQPSRNLDSFGFPVALLPSKNKQG